MLVKICGLTSLQDARLAAETGADLLGVVMACSSPRRATQENARAIIKAGFTQRIYLVFGYDDADYIRETYTALANPSTALQIMADHPQVDQLLKLAPATHILPSISAAEKVTPAQVSRWAKHPLVLFDSHRPSPLRSASATPSPAGEERRSPSSTQVAGGTGKTFDPANIAGISRPFLYAGGLTADNVVSIVMQVNPTGVDVASGTEASPGVKDAEKLRKFIQNARTAAQRIQVQQ